MQIFILQAEADRVVVEMKTAYTAVIANACGDAQYKPSMTLPDGIRMECVHGVNYFYSPSI